MKSYVLIHEHAPAECTVAYAAWNGFDSPLRGRPVPSTCARHLAPAGPSAAPSPAPRGHEIWWTTKAQDEASALRQLPPYVRERTHVREVSEVMIG
ncbi:MAG TPA: hypothetical protein VG186_15055 [Solirubrobacteraceae bacterium]|nr:hypothetical protein [Solirubrobacteraceae bacterium]